MRSGAGRGLFGQVLDGDGLLFVFWSRAGTNIQMKIAAVVVVSVLAYAEQQGQFICQKHSPALRAQEGNRPSETGEKERGDPDA